MCGEHAKYKNKLIKVTHGPSNAENKPKKQKRQRGIGTGKKAISEGS